MRIRGAMGALAMVLALGSYGAVRALPQNGAIPKTAGQVDETEIRSAIEAQASAWNRADIPAFMAFYEDSPETTFVGATTVNKGFQPILERYKKGYSTPEQMGKLTFTDLDVRLLHDASGPVEFALVTGKFHLDRTAKGEAKKDDGIFSLVWRKGAGGWKIILDHTA